MPLVREFIADAKIVPPTAGASLSPEVRRAAGMVYTQLLEELASAGSRWVPAALGRRRPRPRTKGPRGRALCP